MDEREEDMKKLQQDLNQGAVTSRFWNLKLNPAKCMVMRFGERVDEYFEKYQNLVRACSLSRCITIQVYMQISNYASTIMLI